MMIQELYHTFIKSIRWNFVGSVAFELLKLGQQALLFSLMPAAVYGHIGSAFSLIFLTINIGSFEAAKSLPPFIATITESKQAFRRIMVPYVLTHACILLGASIISYYAWTSLTPTYLLSPLFFMLLIVSEGVRTLLRFFLHVIFIDRAPIVTELLLMIAYLASVWIAYLTGYCALTPRLIFVPYALTSLVANASLTYLIYRAYTALSDHPFTMPRGLWKRMFTTRIFNYATRITKELFRGNFIATVTAYQFGFSQAAIIKFASYIVDALKGIVNTTIGFSGNALLAALKKATLTEKRTAFSVLSRRLNVLLYALLIALFINGHVILRVTYTIKYSLQGVWYALFFIILMGFEYLFIVYEQFYILEERVHSFFLVKLLEAVMLGGILLLGRAHTPVALLASLLTARCIAYIIMVFHTYRTWRISPEWRANRSVLLLTTGMSLVILYILTRFIT